MDQIHHHYHGPTTFQGTNIPSHYIPAEKPYAVYAFVWEGPTTDIAQLIGTMLVGEIGEDGKVKYDSKPVYRMPSRPMFEFRHCFIPEDMGPIENDVLFLGFEGDTLHLEDVANLVWMDRHDADGLWRPADIVESLQLAGMNIEIAENNELGMLSGFLDTEYHRNTDSCDYFLAVKKGAPVRVKVWEDGKSVSAKAAISRMCHLIKLWQDIGVTFDGLKMCDDDIIYQEEVDELMELARIYGQYRYEDDGYGLFSLLACREVLGTGRCFYDDYVKAMYKGMYNDYKHVDRDLEWAIENGLANRDGNIIQFSPEFERFASWQWVLKDQK